MSIFSIKRTTNLWIRIMPSRLHYISSRCPSSEKLQLLAIYFHMFNVYTDICMLRQSPILGKKMEWLKNVQVNWSCLAYVISFRVNTFNLSWLRLTYLILLLATQFLCYAIVNVLEAVKGPILVARRDRRQFDISCGISVQINQANSLSLQTVIMLYTRQNFLSQKIRIQDNCDAKENVYAIDWNRLDWSIYRNNTQEYITE